MEIDVSKTFSELLETVNRIASDAASDVEAILADGIRRPLSREEAGALLTRVIELMAGRAVARGDQATALELRDTDVLVKRLMAAREGIVAIHQVGKHVKSSVVLEAHDGIAPGPVRPSPVFHEREVPVMEGFVRTRDIRLWDENERLDIHLNQFRRAHGRKPTADELIHLMLGDLPLPGVDELDQFQIRDLACSVAVNGVRQPPIIDIDGTLLDGNRRVTACHLILTSDEFDVREKQRAEWIRVWQLTPHATQADREAVVVSLNFERDHKQDWPEYVKAKKVHAEWQAMLSLESKASAARQKELKRELSKKFALGPDPRHVSRYIEMVELADEFEDYHVSERNRDRFEVKHKAERYFQYFAELGRGKGAGGVYHSLNQDDEFKKLVFDLLLEGKFSNWNKVRDLKYVANNEEALSFLRAAREEADVDRAQGLVDDGCSAARVTRSVERTVASNKRIEVFVDWLLNAPVRLFKQGDADSITSENLRSLHDALKLVEGYLEPEAGQ